MGAVLLGGTALAHRRQLSPDGLRCSRTKPWVAVTSTPRWALLGAWVAVAGCVTRIVAQAVVGFGAAPYGGGLSVLLFESGFLLAGTALPLVLVYRLGRIFPRWMLLWPGAGLGTGITSGAQDSPQRRTATTCGLASPAVIRPATLTSLRVPGGT
jgi:hypothetical protein